MVIETNPAVVELPACLGASLEFDAVWQAGRIGHADIFWQTGYTLSGDLVRDSGGYFTVLCAGVRFLIPHPEARSPLPGPARPSITCRYCGMTSHHSEDVRQRYCSNCKRFGV